MNRTRILILGVTALVLSAVVTVLVYRELSTRLNPTIEDPDQIVVAREKMPLGSRLEAHHLRTVPWPKGVAIEGSFSTPEEVIGRGVIIPLLPNEPILDSKLAPREGGAGLTSAIPEGMRAVAVKVNNVIGVAGFVLPGTRVDVIVTGNPGTERDQEISKVILENVQVLAADQNVERDAQGQPQNVQVITLLVTPDDAQKLALASVDGRLQLALRNPMDLEKADPSPFSKAALYLGASSMPEPAPEPKPAPRRAPRPAPKPTVVAATPPPPPPPIEVELIQGTERESWSFQPKGVKGRPSTDGGGQ